MRDIQDSTSFVFQGIAKAIVYTCVKIRYGLFDPRHSLSIMFYGGIIIPKLSLK